MDETIYVCSLSEIAYNESKPSAPLARIYEYLRSNDDGIEMFNLFTYPVEVRIRASSPLELASRLNIAYNKMKEFNVDWEKLNQMSENDIRTLNARSPYPV